MPLLAHIASSARVDPTATVGPFAVIGEDVEIGPGVTIGAHVTIHAETKIAEGVRIDDGAVLGKLPTRAKNSATTDERPLPPLRVGPRAMVGTHAVLYRGLELGADVLVADFAQVREETSIGEGTIVGRGAYVENRCRVGRWVKIESMAFVAAFSEIGDRCFVAPMVTTTNDNFVGRSARRKAHYGGVKMETGARIGAGATILPGAVIGRDALIGAGSLVRGVLPPGQIAYGAPARPVRPVPDEQRLETQGYPELSERSEDLRPRGHSAPPGPRAFSVELVDAFTDRPGAGNRAGVVLDAEHLDPDDMRAIARVVSASETAFVAREADGLHLRYFAPGGEIPFCGHATVAALARSFELGRIPAGSIWFRCGDGRFAAEVGARAGGPFVRLEVPTFPSEPAAIGPDELADALGELELATDLEVARAGPRLLVPLGSPGALGRLAPRARRIAELCRGLGLRGFYVFARAGGEVHARYFAPLVGVTEDPVTGAAAGPLLAYLLERGALVAPAELTIRQGEAIGRPGTIEASIDAEGHVHVRGEARSVMSGLVRIESAPP